MALLGAPCWYELTTADPDATTRFFGPLLGWSFRDAGMEGFDYTLAHARRDGAETMVAGLYPPFDGQPEAWLVYFAADDLDATLMRAIGLGATILQPASDVPGTGRFAVLADPQGAAFGLFQPLDGLQGGAFAPPAAGHGCWHELMVPDPVAAMTFYRAVLGWQESTVMPMGETGAYRLFSWQGQDIGGMMGLPAPDAPPCWLPYFGVVSIAGAMAKITASGGTVVMGPMPVPGDAVVCIAQDPRGSHFALVGGT